MSLRDTWRTSRRRTSSAEHTLAHHASTSQERLILVLHCRHDRLRRSSHSRKNVFCHGASRPDGAGQVWFNELRSGFAHNRLSIIDLTLAVGQPMRASMGHHWSFSMAKYTTTASFRRELEARGQRFSFKERH